ncbi:MAG: cell wall hydrolase [Hyphomicrobiales bacterium]|nr:cell wall hydrolase [Hyphomicrobiales bacterium]
MARSRLAWMGSTVAPWAIGLGFLVSITAQAGQEPQEWRSRFAQSEPDRAAPVRQALLAAVEALPAPLGGVIQPASLTLGAPDALAAIPDEIEPKIAMKAARGALPAVDRSDKSDPFLVLRPGFTARLNRSAPFDDAASDPGAGSRSPSAAQVEAPPRAPFGDGATPTVPLDVALNSSTPTPSDGKLIVRATPPAPQTTVAQQASASGKPNYAALIEPKDSARQMRCLAEAIYFESRGEPEAGQAAVAQVVMNRVRSGIFPADVCGVVYQDRNRPFACQFSFACEGRSLRIEEPGPWAVATRIAQSVVSGAAFNPKVAEALNYHATYVMPFWAPYLKRVDRIGNHIFYAMKGGLNWAPGALNGRGDLPPAPAQQASAIPRSPSAALIVAR